MAIVGRHAAAGVDCAGVERALTPAVANLQKGGSIVIVAVYAEPARVDLTLVQDRELSIVGTLMYQRPDYEKAIQYLSDGSIETAPLITKRFHITDYAKAYDFVVNQASETMKVLIDVPVLARQPKLEMQTTRLTLSRQLTRSRTAYL